MKKKSLKSVKKKTWDVFSKYVRLRDAIETTDTRDMALCCSCGKQYPAFGVGCLQAGHFIPGRGNAVLFDEKGVHAQCYNCNINLKGNWPGYYKFMLEKYGQDEINRLIDDSHKTVKYTVMDLEEMQVRFLELIDKL